MDEKEPQILYHYCSLETFNNIIRNHTLRFSDVTKSNDSEEVMFTINCYKNYLIKKIEKCNDTLPVNMFKYEIDKTLDAKKFYTFCMSSKKDLLSQWRGYAPNGGVAIGFNFEKLKQYIEDSTILCSKIKLEKLHYIDKNNPNKLNNEFDKWDNSHPFNNVENLLRLSVVSKNKGFEEECEYRMYFENFEKVDHANQPLPKVIVGNHKPCEIDFSIHNNDLKSYFDLSFTFDLIDEIIIGPKLNITEELLNSFLVKCDTNNEIDFSKLKIETTKLSYR